MIKYRRKTVKPTDPPGVRLVHNFYPGPHDDPGRDRPYGLDGFRFWITDEPNEREQRCFCGWLDGREHYGTVRVIDSDLNATERRNLWSPVVTEVRTRVQSE
jgi:hypothetical protein